MKFEHPSHIFEKYLKIKFYENAFHSDRQTDTMKPVVVFRNFANAPKNMLCLGLIGRQLQAVNLT
jgi:hypothetical protein